MKRALREPLLHFVALGVVIFAIHAWRQNAQTMADNAQERLIDVSAATITSLKDAWMPQFQLTPVSSAKAPARPTLFRIPAPMSGAHWRAV